MIISIINNNMKKEPKKNDSRFVATVDGMFIKTENLVNKVVKYLHILMYENNSCWYGAAIKFLKIVQCILLIKEQMNRFEYMNT